MKISRSILVHLALFFALLVFAAPAKAQYVYGVTALQLDPDLGRVYGYSATLLDYYSCYYYDAAVVGTLYEGSTAIDSGSYHGVCTAEVYTDGYLQDDRLYAQVSNHYIIAYYYYYYYGWYDPYGFFSFGSGDHGGGFNYYGCYCPAYFAQSTQSLGSTQVALYNQGPCNRTPTLSGPTNPVTRGDTATFTIGNRCSTAQIRDWSFTDGNNNTVNRGTSSATSWSGKLVTSGTVRVTVQQGGNTHSLSKSVTVNPRNNFAFTAVTPTKVTNNFNCQENGTLSVPATPSSSGRLGHTCLIQRANWNDTTISDNGPNHDFKYVTSASNSDSNQTAHPATAVYYLIHPDLETSTSDFFKSQCGTYHATNNPNGFISGSQLLANTRNHEMGSVKGHYQQYVETQNKPANNIGVGMEEAVGAPSTPLANFRQALVTEVNRRRNIIETAFAVEACNGQVNNDEQCVYHGPINYSPYRPCPASGLNGQASSSSRVDLGWTDNSFNETAFRVERRESGGSAFNTVGNAAAQATSFADTTVTGSRAYVYRVFSVNAAGDSTPSNEVTVNVPPPAPTGLSAETRKSQIGLSWSYSGGAGDAFKIERRTGAGAFAEIATTAAGALSYTDTAVLGGTTYTYRVRATGPFGTSAPSNEASATTAGTAPSPPQPPSNLSGSAASTTLVNLFWTDNSSDEQGFKIERSTWGGAFVEIAAVGAGVTSYSDASVGAGTSYAYQVRAWSDAGSSAPSPQVSVNTPPAGSPPNAPCCVWGQSDGGYGSVTLWWSDLSNDEDGFVVERNDGWGFYGVLYTLPNQTTATDYGLQQGQTYIYRIVAENPYGQSYSEEFYYYAPYWWEQ